MKHAARVMSRLRREYGWRRFQEKGKADQSQLTEALLHIADANLETPPIKG
jgi:hypothetical protein